MKNLFTRPPYRPTNSPPLLITAGESIAPSGMATSNPKTCFNHFLPQTTSY